MNSRSYLNDMYSSGDFLQPGESAEPTRSTRRYIQRNQDARLFESCRGTKLSSTLDPGAMWCQSAGVDFHKMKSFAINAAGRKSFTQKSMMTLIRQVDPSDPNQRCEMMTNLLPASVKRILGGFKVAKLLGSGKFGTVALLQKGQRAVAAKFVRGDDPSAWMSVEDEFKISTLFGMYGLSPQTVGQVQTFRGSDRRKRYFYTMQTADTVFSTYFECIVRSKYPRTKAKRSIDAIIDAFRILFHRMKMFNVTHGDMHDENVMVKFTDDGESNRIYLIDCGQAIIGHFDPLLDVSQLIRGMVLWAYKDKPDVLNSWEMDYFVSGMRGILRELGVTSPRITKENADELFDRSKTPYQKGTRETGFGKGESFEKRSREWQQRDRRYLKKKLKRSVKKAKKKSRKKQYNLRKRSSKKKKKKKNSLRKKKKKSSRKKRKNKRRVTHKKQHRYNLRPRR